MREPSDPFLPREPHGVTLAEHSAHGRRRLAALPLWLAAAILIGAVGVLAVIMQGEYIMFHNVLGTILPSAIASHLTAISITVTVAYLTIWHTVGFRAARGSAVAHEVTREGRGRNILGAFGLLGAGAAAVGLAVMGGLAYVRADALATKHADNARINATELDGTPLSGPKVNELAQSAYDDVFVNDLLWTVLTLAMLAIAALCIGLAMHSIGRSALPSLVDAQLWWARLLADRADEQRRTREAELVDEQTAAKTRTEVAARTRAALNDRYDHARAHVRVYLAARKADPEFTDGIVPPPENIAAQ